MGLKDKAARIDFSSLDPSVMVNPDLARPKTAPGAMMALANDQRSELLRENERLRAEAAKSAELEGRLGAAIDELKTWDGAKATRLIDPKDIRRSEYANRHESGFEGESFRALKAEIKEAGGNVQPIKIRAVANPGDGPRFEIVFGHRRHEACLQLGMPVLAFVDNLDDKALFEEMERENRERADLSAWEQGVMYARALDRGLYPSVRQLASAIGVDSTNLSKSLALARLPKEVLDAFASPLDLQFRWSTALKAALENDASGLKSRAVALASDGRSRTPKEVFLALTSANGVESTKPARTFERDGKVLATLKVSEGGRPVLYFQVDLSATQQRDLTKLIEKFVTGL
jgi:ParB family chromosome partitioning protein